MSERTTTDHWSCGCFVSDRMPKRNGGPSVGPPGGTDGDSVPMATIRFDVVVRITLGLLVFGVVFCVITGVLFQLESIDENPCNVSNTMPIISSLLAPSPQRYVLRLCFALFSVPRFVVAYVYWLHFRRQECFIQMVSLRVYHRVVNWIFVLSLADVTSLIGIIYISSIENFPVHAVLFIIFTLVVQVYEYLTIKLFRWCYPVKNSYIRRSYTIKKLCFFTQLIFSFGMSYYYYMHHFYCVPGAISKFSFCEYIVLFLRMVYFYTGTYDLVDYDWVIVGRPVLRMDTVDNHKTE